MHLYVYNLRTKHDTVIARSVARMFNPRWINATTLAYDNPKIKGARLRAEVEL